LRALRASSVVARSASTASIDSLRCTFVASTASCVYASGTATSAKFDHAVPTFGSAQYTTSVDVTGLRGLRSPVRSRVS